MKGEALTTTTHEPTPEWACKALQAAEWQPNPENDYQWFRLGELRSWQGAMVISCQPPPKTGWLSTETIFGTLSSFGLLYMANATEVNTQVLAVLPPDLVAKAKPFLVVGAFVATMWQIQTRQGKKALVAAGGGPQ